jgi:hypothetical protein
MPAPHETRLRSRQQGPLFSFSSQAYKALGATSHPAHRSNVEAFAVSLDKFV